MKLFLPFVLIICFGCHSSIKKVDDPVFHRALENGHLVNEGYQRCLNFVYDWLKFADPETGLIPRNLRESRKINKISGILI